MDKQKFEPLEAYEMAQIALVQLKTAIYNILLSANNEGLRNVDIGRSLGIYHGHARHEGHISRTLLAIMETEGVVQQNDKTKTWKLVLPELK